MDAVRAVAPARSESRVSAAVHDVLRSPGQALEPRNRARLESYLGHDFSQVAVHTDARAAASARLVDAAAYTVGNHVVFGAGQYQPATTSGLSLLAHELAHVKQRSSRPPESAEEVDVGEPDNLEEQQASGAAASLLLGAERAPVSVGSAPHGGDHLQRQGTAPPPIPTTGGITLTIDEKGRVDLTVSGPSATPIVSKPTIGIRRDPDGKHYHLLVGGRDSVVTADQIPDMLKSLGGAGKPGDPIVTRRIMVPTCAQLAAMGNKFENYELSRKVLEAPGIQTALLPMTPEFFDALVTACSATPAKAPAGPESLAIPDVSLPASPLLASILGSDTLDNFVFDDDKLTSRHVDEIKNHLAPRLRSLLGQYPLASITVTGHTDEVGGDRYNQNLGERRAKAVIDELVAEKIPRESISSVSAGKTEPLLATGRAEGRNRRVEVRFHTGPTVPGGLLREPPGPPPGPSPIPAPPVPGPPATQPGAPVPKEGKAPEAPESHFRITLQLTPQHTFPIRGTNAPGCGDWISFPIGLMWNWDGISLAGDKLQLFPQPEVDWDLVQVACQHPGNVIVQDNLLKWNILKDVLELSLVGQVSFVEGSPISLQPGLQLSWHPLTRLGGNQELQFIFGPALNWQPGPGNLGFVVGGGIRFEFPH